MLTIGQLSAASGVPTSTIRFWERRELLRPRARQGGQRRYDEDALWQVGMLRLCQDAGFTLTEIRQIMAQRATDPTRWRELVEAKMVDVERSLRRLNKAYDLLSHALECTHDDIVRCPRFQEAVSHRTGPRTEPATANDPRELAG
ncbi:MAG TPA: MerR family transcriptional regulator [Pseudonocardiaceae bacterium]|nr:MerR family transcriptional regulator [Pseudonocardiaceae bacterium]